jgi:hypothetical protein
LEKPSLTILLIRFIQIKMNQILVKVYINNHEVDVFDGANVGDAVLSYSTRAFKKVRTGTLSIFDSFGNLTEPDGKLTNGQILTLKKT